MIRLYHVTISLQVVHFQDFSEGKEKTQQNKNVMKTDKVRR